ncbi:MAG: prolyl hydroxylase family protein [Sphingomicrobium sp.]
MSDADPPPFYDPPTMPFATQRSELRAAVGREVGKGLDSTPGLWRLGSSLERPVQLYFQESFLTADECRQLRERIDSGVYPSPLYEKEKYEGVRTSQSCNLDVYDSFVADIETRIADMLGIDRSWGEPLQGQKYEVGQEFKAHSDFFYIDQPYWSEYEPHGGQRTWTAMIYLNEPKKGGGTGFPYLDLVVQPRLGRILIWNNMAGDGSPNPWTQHEGQPVEAGTKYIVTKWYRERTFC